ncbi:MAG: PEP-utilizing enzyme, partial [Bacteroidales bacterium]
DTELVTKEVLQRAWKEILSSIPMTELEEDLTCVGRLMNLIILYRRLVEVYGKKSKGRVINLINEQLGKYKGNTEWPAQEVEKLMTAIARGAPCAEQLACLLNLRKRIYEEHRKPKDYPESKLDPILAVYPHFIDKHGNNFIRHFDPDDAKFRLYYLNLLLSNLEDYILVEAQTSLLHRDDSNYLRETVDFIRAYIGLMQYIGLQNYQFQQMEKLLDSAGLTVIKLQTLITQLQQSISLIRVRLDEGMGDMVDIISAGLSEETMNPAFLSILKIPRDSLRWEHLISCARTEFVEALIRSQGSLIRFEKFLDLASSRLKRFSSERFIWPEREEVSLPSFVGLEEVLPGCSFADISEKGESLVCSYKNDVPVPYAVIFPVSERDISDKELLSAVHKIEEGVKTAGLQSGLGTAFGSTDDPLILSMRLAGAFDMPGQLNTTTNIGITSKTLPGLFRRFMAILQRRFPGASEKEAEDAAAWSVYDSLRRFYQDYAMLVYKMDRNNFDTLLSKYKKEKSKRHKVQLSGQEMRELAARYLSAIESEHGRDAVPDDSFRQLYQIMHFSGKTWQDTQDYRRAMGLEGFSGVARIIQIQVLGNAKCPREIYSGDELKFPINFYSGAGVVISSTEGTINGSIGPSTQGFDIADGVVIPEDVRVLKQSMPESYGQLERHVRRLEQIYNHPVEIEYTIQDGRVWILQVRMAALQMIKPRFEPNVKSAAIQVACGHSLAVRGGIRGLVVTREALDDITYVSMLLERVKQEFQLDGLILCIEQATPEDMHYLRVKGIVGFVARLGGVGMHDARIANSLKLAAVVGIPGLEIEGARVRFGKASVSVGDTISIDGDSGVVYLGALPLKTEALSAVSVASPLIHSSSSIRQGIKSQRGSSPAAYEQTASKPGLELVESRGSSPKAKTEASRSASPLEPQSSLSVSKSDLLKMEDWVEIIPPNFIRYFTTIENARVKRGIKIIDLFKELKKIPGVDAKKLRMVTYYYWKRGAEDTMPYVKDRRGWPTNAYLLMVLAKFFDLKEILNDVPLKVGLKLGEHKVRFLFCWNFKYPSPSTCRKIIEQARNVKGQGQWHILNEKLNKETMVVLRWLMSGRQKTIRDPRYSQAIMEALGILSAGGSSPAAALRGVTRYSVQIGNSFLHGLETVSRGKGKQGRGGSLAAACSELRRTASPLASIHTHRVGVQRDSETVKVTHRTHIDILPLIVRFGLFLARNYPTLRYADEGVAYDYKTLPDHEEKVAIALNLPKGFVVGDLDAVVSTINGALIPAFNLTGHVPLAHLPYSFKRELKKYAKRFKYAKRILETLKLHEEQKRLVRLGIERINIEETLTINEYSKNFMRLKIELSKIGKIKSYGENEGGDSGNNSASPVEQLRGSSPAAALRGVTRYSVQIGNSFLHGLETVSRG